MEKTIDKKKKKNEGQKPLWKENIFKERREKGKGKREKIDRVIIQKNKESAL